IMGPGRMAEEYIHSHGSKVSEAMTTALQTASEDTSLEDVVKLMEKNRIKRVPVMHGARMVGIITRANLMRAMIGLAREAKPVKASDSAIREQMLKTMQEQTWAPTAMVDVQVHDGVVELWGTILDERQRDALKVAAENVAGVKGVKDHLAWIEPVSGTIIESQDGAAA
ncbi:MAG TPA: CBS domain-containing protein, partial [Pseudolabrys sp.]|nr:CBS domain-containing protein [Pseudolabrys sp.]